MKKLIVIVCMVTMVMGLAMVANAADENWLVNLKIGNSTLAKGYTSGFGTKTGAVGTYVAGEDALLPPAGAGNDQAEIYTVVGPNKMLVDKRTPFAGAPIVWQITVGYQASYADANIYMRVFNPTGTATLLDANPGFDLKLFKVAEFGGTRQLVWTATPGVSSTSSSGYFGTSYAKGTHYFELEASAVPEPGSIVAMLSGLVGLAGYSIRRRK